MNNWKNIWNSKNVVNSIGEESEYEYYCKLKKANGYDVAVENEERYFRSFYEGWISFYNKVLELTNDEIKSVFEVGCGSGVNLYMFRNRLNKDAEFGGIDYSEPMVKSAKISTGSDDFTCCGADEISVEPQYDIVFSEGVFQYFESLDYAETVIRKMICKAKKLVYIGELHDKKFETELLEYRRKTIENYDEKYSGLKKQFYERDWIVNIAEEYGKKVLFTSVDNPEYINGKYEFNCFIY